MQTEVLLPARAVNQCGLGESLNTLACMCSCLASLQSASLQILNASVIILALHTVARVAQVDMNVSLTAISLLWNAADLLSKLSRAPASPEGPAAASLDAAQFEELLRILFIALQVPSSSPLFFPASCSLPQHQCTHIAHNLA